MSHSPKEGFFTDTGSPQSHRRLVPVEGDRGGVLWPRCWTFTLVQHSAQVLDAVVYVYIYIYIYIYVYNIYIYIYIYTYTHTHYRS